MISLYKWKKNAMLLLMGSIPLIAFLLIFFAMGFSYQPLPGFPGLTYPSVDLMGVMIALFGSAAIVVIMFIVNNKAVRHAFTEMLEGKGLVSFIIDSTGVIGSFIARVDAPNMDGVVPGATIKNVEDIYDTDILHRLLVPKKIGMAQAITYEPGKNGGIVLGETKNVLILPDQKDESKHLFSFMNRPVFIYNKVIGQFLSRDALAKFEKDIQVKHNAQNIFSKVQSTDVSFRDFGRYIGETVRPKKKGLFGGSPYLKYFIYGIVIILIIVILIILIAPILTGGVRL